MEEPINKKRSIGVGIFIIVGLLFLVGGVMTIGNLHSTFSRKMTVSTVFEDVNGLQAGNNIWFSGVKVGTVKKMEFIGGSHVRVVMNINEESKQYIRKDAKVKISSDGLIGNRILVIYGGTMQNPGVQEGDVLGNETQSSTEDMLKTLQQNNLNILMLTQKLADGKGTVGQLLNSDSVYNNIIATTRSLQLASRDAQVLFASLSEYGSKFNNKGTLANDLVTDTTLFHSLKSTAAQLQTVAANADQMVAKLKQDAANPRSPLGVMTQDEQAGAALKATLTNLESSSKKLDQDLEGLQHSFLLRKYFKKEEAKKTSTTTP